jgi:SAM-dependent methyltransferase
VTRASQFWDVLAPHHSAIENSYLDLASLCGILPDIHPPVLIVGAGQGLLVAELRRNGFQCDGVDLSEVMIEYAKRRRGLTLIQADARALPFGDRAYGTIIYATGVVDFMGDEMEIQVIMNEARRIVEPAGNIFVAFYRLSAATEGFLVRLGLLQNDVLFQRETLEIYRLRPAQVIVWAAKKAKVGYAQAAILALRAWALSTLQEKKVALNMQRIFAKTDQANALFRAAPEKQPYRNEAAIKNLFQRLAIPIKHIEAFGSCNIARI